MYICIYKYIYIYIYIYIDIVCIYVHLNRERYSVYMHGGSAVSTNGFCEGSGIPRSARLVLVAKEIRNENYFCKVIYCQGGAPRGCRGRPAPVKLYDI